MQNTLTQIRELKKKKIRSELRAIARGNKGVRLCAESENALFFHNCINMGISVDIKDLDPLCLDRILYLKGESDKYQEQKMKAQQSKRR